MTFDIAKTVDQILALPEILAGLTPSQREAARGGLAFALQVASLSPAGQGLPPQNTPVAPTMPVRNSAAPVVHSGEVAPGLFAEEPEAVSLAGQNFTIFTDGSCLGNPGPGGWSAVVIGGPEISGGLSHTTNNAMEVTAAIRALEMTPVGAVVEIVTDSEYTKDMATTNNKARKNTVLIALLRRLCAARQVTFTWVKGHAGHPDNERADELAKDAAERMQAQLRRAA